MLTTALYSMEPPQFGVRWSHPTGSEQRSHGEDVMRLREEARAHSVGAFPVKRNGLGDGVGVRGGSMGETHG